MTNWTIGALAREAGVGVETIRFYQRKGLVDEPARAGGVRRYDRRDLDRLRFIRKAQSAGFTLADIHELLTLDRSDDRPRARALAKARIEELDRKIVELQDARSALRRLAKECEAGREGPCPIIASFG